MGRELTVSWKDFILMLSIIEGFRFRPKDEAWHAVPWTSQDRRLEKIFIDAGMRDFWWQRLSFVSKISNEDAVKLSEALQRMIQCFAIERKPIPSETRFENGARFNEANRWVEAGEAAAFANTLLPFVAEGGFSLERKGAELVLRR